jgi:hypothetical protein
MTEEQIVNRTLPGRIAGHPEAAFVVAWWVAS